jgi:hypothetical protein
MRQDPEPVSKAAKLADHTIISIMISVQFLCCIFYLLSIPWAFNYGGGSASNLLPWIAYWCHHRGSPAEAGDMAAHRSPDMELIAAGVFDLTRQGELAEALR